MIMWWPSDYYLIIIWLSSDYHLIIIWFTSDDYLKNNKEGTDFYYNCIYCWLLCDYHLTVIQWSHLINCCFVIDQQTSKQTNKQQRKPTYKQTNILNIMIMWLPCDYHKMINICSYNGHSMILWKSYDHNMIDMIIGVVYLVIKDRCVIIIIIIM